MGGKYASEMRLPGVSVSRGVRFECAERSRLTLERSTFPGRVWEAR